MKKTILLFILFISKIIFAQEVFINSTNKEYLSLGSTRNNKQKFLDLKKNKISWINVSDLKQTDMFLPLPFWHKVAENSIGFYANGYEPDWEAKINKNKLQFKFLEEINTNITIDIKDSLTTNFVAMFHSDNNNIYGVIRSLAGKTQCEATLDEQTTIYEIFINYQGTVLEGCAYLDKV